MDHVESDLPAHIPPLDAIADAYQDIQAHNKTHARRGASITRTMTAFVEGKHISAMTDEVTQKSNEGDMAGELQALFHGDVFTRIGLHVAPIGESAVLSSGDRVTNAALVPVIDNPSLYTEFLSILTPEDAANEVNGVLLRDVVNTLEQTVVNCYYPPADAGLTDDEKEALMRHGSETLDTFVQIDSHYKRLGLGNEDSYSDVVTATQIPIRERKRHSGARTFLANYRALEKQVAYRERNIVAEYIEGHEYVTPPDPDAFGPIGWHRDNQQWRWREAFNFLARMEGDERTRAFGDEVRQNLMTSVTAAIEEIDSPDAEPYITRHRGELVNIGNFLSGQEYDQAQLDEYIKPPEYS